MFSFISEQHGGVWQSLREVSKNEGQGIIYQFIMTTQFIENPDIFPCPHGKCSEVKRVGFPIEAWKVEIKIPHRMRISSPGKGDEMNRLQL